MAAAQTSDVGHEPARILIVCTGNICRSPFIERMLQRELDVSWAYPHGIRVESAGTAALTGQPMDNQASMRAAGVGIDTSGFVARQLTEHMLTAADLVLTATVEHRREVSAMYPRGMRRNFTVRELPLLMDGTHAPTAADAGSWLSGIALVAAARRSLVAGLSAEDLDIADPYGKGDGEYAAMVADIRALMPRLVEVLSAPSG